MTRNKLALALALTFALGGAYAPLSAQVRQDEILLVRDATMREQAGDFAGAQRILENILKGNPQSLSALLSLERVLRLQDKLESLLPYVEAHLRLDRTSAIGHQMLVRALSALNRIPDLERAGEAWIKAVPRIETPYREVARIWEGRGDLMRAVQYLEMGRARIGKDALALELGDMFARLDEPERAVREWERAIGPDARGLLLVQRRLTTLKDGGAGVLPGLVEVLAASGSTPRKRAAVQLAIDAGMGAQAEQIAQRTLSELKGADRQTFLVEVARRADAAQLPRVAYWAYTQFALNDFAPEQLLAIRARIAELALAVGDTASAARGYRELEQSFEAGSPQRRQATALRIQLQVKEGKLDAATEDLTRFRAEYAEAPELDATAAMLATAHFDKGDLEAAARSLERVAGPRSNLVRGRIALRRGDVAGARAAVMSSAPALQGAEATQTLKLATLLGKVSREGGELLGEALAAAGSGQAKTAVTTIENRIAALPELERPAILDFAAALADRGQLPLDGERLRRRIVTEFPKSNEAPAALLTLARSLTERGGATEEAKTFLEKLIIEYPRSALVPQARQELERLQGRSTS
ncbi:MAG TPA: tetratricopeptide repeat protein [Longimicrobiales bacterium]